MKPTVLVFVQTYLPGFKSGGPVRSVSNLVAALGTEIDFRVVTFDHDMGSAETYSGVQQGVWTKVGNAQVLYLSRLGFFSLYRLLMREKADFLYLNSFFNRPFSIFPLVARTLGARGQKRVVLAPRGEFAPSALRIRAIRKSVWIAIARLLSVYKNAIWQASSVFEDRDIRQGFANFAAVRNVAVMVASDLVVPSADIANSGGRVFKEPGKLRIVFLSRVSPMKNLRGAIRMLRQISGIVEFHIYGPREDAGYWNECEEEIRQLPSNVHVEVHPQVDHAKVRETLAAHHLLLLPSLGENFGHAIYEALAAGTPVLISDRTPWKGLASRGVGWEFPLEREDLFREALETCVVLDDVSFSAFSAKALRIAFDISQSEEIIEANRALFRPLEAHASHEHATACHE